MRRPALLAGLGVLLLLADLAARPWRDHVRVVTGMAVDGDSWLLGPLVILIHLLAALAPILIVAAAADVVLARRRV